MIPLKMASPQNVEMEAAKFLHKLIQDSKDEPAKLATKLYVILQHMKSSGKEHSMPYQVISRAMETVINQHGLDIEALMSSRMSSAGGSQPSDAAITQFGGSSQTVGIAKDSKMGLPENEVSKVDTFASSRPPVGPSSAGHEYFQGPGSHRNSQSLDHESPSSMDSRSANSQSQERRDSSNWDKQANQKDGKKTTTKRKRGDTSVSTEPHNDNPQQLDSRNTVVNTRKGKMSKMDSSPGFAIKASEHANFNILQSSSQMEQFSTLSGSMRPVIRSKQESQHLMEKQLDSANTNNSMSRAPNLKYPDETEVSSSHNPLSQQQVPSAAHDIMGAWNQNKTGLQLDKSQIPRFPSNVPGNAEIPLQSAASSAGMGSFGKVHGGPTMASGSFPTTEPGFTPPLQFGGSVLATGKVLEHDGGSSNKLADSGKLAQAGRQNSVSEMSMLRNAGPRDAGKSPVLPSPVNSGMPFMEQQLKQLRAQCLVFLAFRNGLMPKKLHLDIALGNIFPKEGGSADGPRKELMDHRGKVTSSEPNNAPDMMPFGRMNNAKETDKIPPGTLSTGRFQDIDSSSKEAGNMKAEDKSGPAFDQFLPEERKYLQTSRKPDVETQTSEITASQASMTMASQHDSSGTRSGLAFSVPGDKVENGHQLAGRANQAVSLMAANKHINPEIVNWTTAGNHDDVSRGVLPSSAVQHELVPERRDNVQSQGHNLSNISGSGNHHSDNNLSSFSSRDHWKPVSGTDNNHHTVHLANMTPKQLSQEQVQEDSLVPDVPPSPKYTMSEKWIMDRQKKKFLDEQKWILKQQQTKQRIATCFYKLKENVSSSEDISAKTKSVIELKKLQLLELQRRLRSDFLKDFFKPINPEIDRLKSLKKHKHGRRVKQLEKFEQKMKEERQKRIRERQKEFFGEIEVHKERLDDVFKFKRERWKVFNKYAKEFHKRKERIHREKIDRIQREKINLLKINDVEGYLRMVQDAKSDRVKQLLKETEKYLQKLGSKLQEAKSMTTRFEQEMDDPGAPGIIDKGESAIDNEDESDQAKHYLESNEKYYMMAHSIKESIAEQPSMLHGGKLREYQMNGLRWLVSLYNNHLNGILADEMGLGKTVQVISLICYLMETKNDRGPFLVVVPSSVLPGWETEINFWAPSINRIVYSGPPEERRKLFKERIVQQKFNNNLDELWALLNFLLPNIFNSSEDFSQWFNKPFQSNGDNSADEALLSEEENLLIINRLHQVLRPFVLRRLKHKVENELPEKIERLIRCEASAYQKLLMKRVEENLGSIGSTKARSVHNSVMELRNICNHPYLSQLHAEEVDNYIPKHYLPPVIRLCGKLEMLDRLLPKLKATDHRVLFFSTMTRLLDVMEEYLHWKQYLYLRLDGHTSGSDRGALIDKFNKPNSPFFIFLLSIRAGGVGVNLQAADTVIIFDTDWNPQVDLQAQARAHRIGQKRDVLVLRFETVQTVEEQVRASAEHKLGVANQSITAGFFDNNTSAEDRREYLESLLRECKKEEAAPVLDDDALNDILARSESEIDVFESVDKQRRDAEAATWRKLINQQLTDNSETLPPLPSRLVTEDDLQEFYEAMKIYEVPKADGGSNVGGVKRKSEYHLDTQHYGRGKRTREVRSYEEQWTEEEFEKMCQVDEALGSPSKAKEEVTETNSPTDASQAVVAVKTEVSVPPVVDPPPASVQPSPASAQPLPASVQPPLATVQPQLAAVQPSLATEQPPQATVKPLPATVQPPPATVQPPPATVQPQPVIVQSGAQAMLHPPHLQPVKEVTPPAKRGRGRPKRVTTDQSPGAAAQKLSVTAKVDTGLPRGTTVSSETISSSNTLQAGIPGQVQYANVGVASSQPVIASSITPGPQSSPVVSSTPGNQATVTSETTSTIPATQCPDIISGSTAVQSTGGTDHHANLDATLNSPQANLQLAVPVSLSPIPSVPVQTKGQGRRNQSGGSGTRRRGKKQVPMAPPVSGASAGEELKPTLNSHVNSDDMSKGDTVRTKQESISEATNVTKEQVFLSPEGVAAQAIKPTENTVDLAQGKQTDSSSTLHGSADGSHGTVLADNQSAGVCNAASVVKETLPKICSSKTETNEPSRQEGVLVPTAAVSDKALPEVTKNQTLEDKTLPVISTLTAAASGGVPSSASFSGSTATEGIQSTPPCPVEHMPAKRSGRKTPNRTEAPRRRGRKQAAIVPPPPDALAGQDPKLSSQLQNKSADTMGNKSAALRGKQGSDTQEVAQSQTGEVHMTAGVPGHDAKRKDQSNYAPQVKQPTNPQAAIDTAAGFNDKKVLGRIQTADVNDVARVMKEVFSGTCLLKTKASESHGKEGKAATNVPLTGKTVSEVSKSQTLVDKVQFSATMSERVAALPDLPVKSDKQTGTADDTKEEVEKPSGPNETAVCTTVVEKSQVKTAAGHFGKTTDPGQHSQEDAIMADSKEVISPIGADENSCQMQPPASDLLATTGSDLNSSLGSVTAEEHVVVPDGPGNKTESLSKKSPKASCSDATGPCLKKNVKIGDNSETTSISMSPELSGAPVPSSITDDGLGDTKKPSDNELQVVSRHDLSSHGSPPILEKPENAGDYTIVTASISRGPDESSVIKPHCSIDIHSTVKPASEESPEACTDNKKLENSTSIIAPDHSSSGEVSGKIILPSPSLITEEKVDDRSEKSPVSSPVEHEEAKKYHVELESSEQLGVSTGGDFVSASTSEVFPATSRDGEQKADGLEPAEELKDSQAEMDIKSGPSTAGENSPEKFVEHLSTLESGIEENECSSVKAIVSSTPVPEEPKDSGVEIAVQLNSNNITGDLLDNIPEPSSSSETTEKIGSLSMARSSVPLNEPKDSEVEMVDQLDSCKGVGCLPEKIGSSPLSCVVINEGKIEDSSVEETEDLNAGKDVQPLKDADESNVQTDPSHVSMILVENVVDNTNAPQSSSVPEEEKIEASSARSPETIDDSSEMGPASLSVQLEGSKDLESNMESAAEACQVVGDVSDNMGSDTLNLPSPSLVSEEEQINGSNVKCLANNSGTLNKSKDGEVDNVDDVDAPLTGGIINRSGSSLETMDQMDATAASLETETMSESVVSTSTSHEVEADVKDSSEWGPDSSPVPEDKLNGNDAETGDDKPELGGSLSKEIERSSEKNLASSSGAVAELEGSDAGINDQVNSSKENDNQTSIDLPVSSIDMEDKKVAGKEESQSCGVVSDTVSENIDHQPQQSSEPEANNDSIVAPENYDSDVKDKTDSPCQNVKTLISFDNHHWGTMIAAAEKSEPEAKAGAASPKCFGGLYR
ncbi:hypothetical protein F8388_013012 [Cannabis sativa]|uniref:Chromatin structure-remodeling complex protein SYD-like n=1 Tax=Cannabis sativa TaxID=3483 RepID=A0A7J6E9X9_CANSA|nr:hypothetical protein F8388_013012 [Cannabis sativa]